jgi:hydroxymethylpyrimidine kinase/phosphomethylpyrimidine kinase
MLCDIDARDIAGIDDMIRVAQLILAFGSDYVLLKGGHFSSREHDSITSAGVPDVLVHANDVMVFNAPRVATRNDHGTGCSLSAALAAGLGCGRSVPDATRDAKSFVLAALKGASTWHLGQGRGPIDHLGWNGE